jgi:hypothetical protein
MPRSTRLFKKRKNVGKPLPEVQKETRLRPSPSSSSAQAHKKPLSASSKKIGNNLDLYKELQTNDSEYIILDVVQLNKMLSDAAACKNCGGNLTVSSDSNIGPASKLVISCDSCDKPSDNPEYYSSAEALIPHSTNKKIFDINLRFIYALRAIGRGQSAANMFCGEMNVPKTPQNK